VLLPPRHRPGEEERQAVLSSAAAAQSIGGGGGGRDWSSRLEVSTAGSGECCRPPMVIMAAAP
jgi:hypothetical protein